MCVCLLCKKNLSRYCKYPVILFYFNKTVKKKKFMHFVCANIFGANVLKPRFKIDVVIMIICSTVLWRDLTKVIPILN